MTKLGPTNFRIAAIAALTIVGASCVSPSSECRTNSECPDGERCVLLDGVFVSGGQCAPDRLFDATADGRAVDAADATDGDLGDGDTATGDAADVDTADVDAADTSEPTDTPDDTTADTGGDTAADTPLDTDGDTCPGPSVDLGGADVSDCRCHFRGEPIGVCADQPLAADGGCQTPENYEADESTCDGLDNDCDGAADEGCPCDYDGRDVGVCADQTRHPDDGSCPEPSAYESSETSCNDDRDNDCDGQIDCADDDCTGTECGGAGTECRDIDDACHEAACGDGADNDGDGDVDCADVDCTGFTCDGGGTECRNGDQECHETDCEDGVDNDGDGAGDCLDSDCDGSTCNGPGTTCRAADTTCHEVDCGDGTDNDGDGDIDCADSDCAGANCGGSAGGSQCLATDDQCHETDCGDGTDNDGDGSADCGDDDCSGESCTRPNGVSGVCCPNQTKCAKRLSAC